MKNIYIFIGILVVVAMAFFGIKYINKPGNTPERTSEYQTVTIKELISYSKQYDGKNILVRGKFTDMTNRPVPLCVPTGIGINPEIREGYKTYSSTWGISNQDGEIGVEVIDENGVHISTKPNYREGQEIELKGTAKLTTVPDFCIRGIRYKSIYIEVNARDIDITLKPLPENLPEDR